MGERARKRAMFRIVALGVVVGMASHGVRESLLPPRPAKIAKAP